ncbi:MAG: ABC transporter substrate-binding protein, partial [Lachnospiraceae bacterium]|nr:ABC transporter substrate-binding protein [Lachnospiraceae bacterium]
MKFKRFLTALLAAVMVMSMVLSGCGGSPSGEETASGMPETAAPDAGGTAEAAGDETAAADAEEAGPVEIPGLTYVSTLDLEYATRFAVHFYEDGYTVIDVIGDRVYLLVPEGAEVPEGLDSDIIVVQQPLDSIYLAATSAMALFVAANAADTIRFSALEADSWYIDEAAALMEAGDIVYAGKYSRPDYELLVNGGCDLAIEST